MHTPTDQPENRELVKVAHDARATHDMAALYFSDLLNHGTPQWIAARIMPAANSGFVTIPGNNFDNPAVLMKQGTWTAVASSRPQPPGAEAYSVAQPFREVRRSRTEEDYYSPFIKGGTVILRAERLSTALQESDRVYLTFDDWASDLMEAMSFAARHSSSLQTMPEPDLMTLLSTSNPLLQIEAFRELVGRQNVLPESVEKHLSSASLHLAAVFTHILLSERKDVDWGPRLAKLVGNVNSDTTCSGIALGAYAAKQFFSNETRTVRAADSVLSAARSRFAVSSRQDEYLDKLLRESKPF